MNGKIALHRLDPNKTALVVVHMVKGVAGNVDTPFNRLFRRRAEETGIIKAQLRLLDGFRKAKAKVVYTAVTYQKGLPGVSPNSPLWRTLFDCVCLMEGTPAVELIDELARRPDPTHPLPTAMRATPARSTCSENGSPRHPLQKRSSAPWGLPTPLALNTRS